MKLIAYQRGADRIMARVLDNKALPFATLETSGPNLSRVSWPRRRLGPGESRSPAWSKFRHCRHGPRALRRPELRRHAEEAHFKVPEHPDIFARWRSTLAVDGQAVPVPHARIASTGKASWR